MYDIASAQHVPRNSVEPFEDVPTRSCLSVSHMLQLKSSYPPNSRRPDLEYDTDVIPQMMLSWEYMPISWSERMSNRRHVASSEPVVNDWPLGKNCNWKYLYFICKTKKDSETVWLTNNCWELKMRQTFLGEIRKNKRKEISIDRWKNQNDI